MRKRRAGSPRPPIRALWQAMDEAVFGQERTLNLRESLPSAAEARSRAEVWLRGRQVTCPEEVLIITGRGNQSAGGVGVIREEIVGLMPALRRKGIIESWREHSPGSLVVKLAPLSTLLGAGKRRRDAREVRSRPDPGALAGLAAETRELLRQLAIRNLDALGIAATEQFLKQETAKAFSTLMESIPDGPGREELLRAAILRVIEEDP